MLSDETFLAPASLSDVRTAVETRLPRAEWICLEGDSSGPVKSLSHWLKCDWSELKELLGKPGRAHRFALQSRLGNPNVKIFRPDRSEQFGTDT